MTLLKPIKSEITEKQIEAYLVKEIKKIGGTAYKFTSPAYRSVPDRMCVLPCGVIAFIECKRPGKKPTDAQQIEINKLNALGHYTVYVDTKQRVDEEIEFLKHLIDRGTK
jgi:hypothetical protein